MPTPEQSSSRQRDEHLYTYRRKLGARDLLPALGVAVGAGLFAFYITRLLLQRTPLMVDRTPRPARGRRGRRSSAARSESDQREA
jgi:hypothetical protein